MNISNVITTDYDKMDTWSSGKNEPNTNPIRTQTNPIKANKMPKQTQNEPKQTQFPMILAYFSSRPIYAAELSEAKYAAAYDN